MDKDLKVTEEMGLFVIYGSAKGEDVFMEFLAAFSVVGLAAEKLFDNSNRRCPQTCLVHASVCEAMLKDGLRASSYPQ